MRFSVVLVLEDPVFTATGINDTTAGACEGAGVDLPGAIRRFLGKGRGGGMAR